MKRMMIVSMAAAVSAVIAAGGVQAKDPGMRLGILKCEQAGAKQNLLIHSVAPFNCVFTGDDGGTEKYKAESGVGIGVDLKWDKTNQIVYTVVGATSDYKIGSYALAGKYFGGKASVALGVGGGAQALVGGGSKNISLQPIAVDTGTGAGVAAGGSYLFLEPAK